MEKKSKEQQKGPVFLVKPAFRMGGLDYLHVSLIALVIVLIALAFSLAYFKQGVFIKNCQYGIVNGTCTAPMYNSSQVLDAAEKILASYSYVNSSLELLPYYSEPNKANVSYAPDQDLWFVNIPYEDPLLNNSVFYISMTLSGKNLSLVHPYLQTVAPVIKTNNSVVSLGTVQIAGKVACRTTTPVPVYYITDPYAPGAFAGIAAAVNLTAAYGNKINMTYDFIFTNYSSRWYAGFGTQHTQLIGEYLYCSSAQGRIGSYATNVSKVFNGQPLDNVTLYQTAEGTGLNLTELNTCLSNSVTTLTYQSQLAGFYNIVSTPQLVVNCQYSSIPQTASDAVNYALSQINQST